MAAAVTIPDPDELVAVDDQDDERDEFAPERVSFFAGDQHEREIATSVWRIYLRESVERRCEDPKRATELLRLARLADRHAATRAAAAPPARSPTVPAEPPAPLPEPAPHQPKDHAMSELADRVDEQHAALRKQLGRDPTNVELVAAVGGSVEAVRAHAKRLGLVLSDGRALRKSAGGGAESGDARAEEGERQAAYERACGRRASGDQRARRRGLARDRRAASRAREDRRRARCHRQGDRAVLDEGSVDR